jgi:hypothetical protein
MRGHRHKSNGTPRTESYAGPVAVKPHKIVEGAHGGIVYVYACNCGATRRVNRNQTFEERGPWVEPEPDIPVSTS